MKLRETPIDGAYEILLDAREDERGFFARTWCVQELAALGLPTRFVQASVSHNTVRGTLRGLHFQWPPSAEGKVVRCEQGAVHDVIVDLRPGSRSFMRHAAIELTAENANALLIPPGLAHGFQTLADSSRVGYAMTDFYAPDLAAGVRWNDPAFGIEWPLPVTTMSARDKAYPDFRPDEHCARYRSASPS